MFSVERLVALIAALVLATSSCSSKSSRITFSSDSVATSDSTTDSDSITGNDSEIDGDSIIDLANLHAAVSLERMLRQAMREPTRDLSTFVRNGTIRHGKLDIAAGDSLTEHLLVIGGNVDVRGKLRGNLVTLDGNVTVHPGGAVSGEILALNGEVTNDGEIGGTVRAFGAPVKEAKPAASEATDAPDAPKQTTFQVIADRLAEVVGTFLTLLALGVGLVLFARPKLEVVADTVSHSFGRSLLAGFIGQILLLPTFGILVVGLIVSVVGILLLPFAVAAYTLLAGIGLVGGYLAVAHAIGEVYTRRRIAGGASVSPNSYRYVAFGLGALAVLWLGWSLFGRIPIAGTLLCTAASLLTWLAVTAGLGAMLLSRAGRRTTFTGWER